MSSIVKRKELQIPLQHISMATNGFDNANFIAKGGFGSVYKGVSKKLGRIAVKRLDHRQGQGEREFRMEITLLSTYKHENIVSLLGFCDEDGEKILVYKYESKGSLDKYVELKDLNWIQRLQICLDVARGLKYLHDDVGSQNRIMHRDIKSANILLDKNWKAKISDFGLSREGPANTESSFVISDPCGTVGYMDPNYCAIGYLTQKTDVYSFGVVLCEVLCGSLTHVRYKDDHAILSILFQKHYINRTLHHIIPSYLYKQISTGSLGMFSHIAYQCLKTVQERPKMKHVVEKLEEALHNQLRAKKEAKPAIRGEKTDCKTNKVIVKREKADRLKFLEGAQKESNRSVKFLSTVLESSTEGLKKLEQGEPPKEEEKKYEEVEKAKEKKRAKEEAKPAAHDEEKGEASKDPPPPPPLQEVVLKVSMYCEDCANRVRQCLIGFEGVEDVFTYPETHKVVVKGKNIDPSKVLKRVQEKMHRKVELLLPVSKPPVKEVKKQKQEKPPKQKEKHERPSLITSVLKVHMHCESCAQEIKKCITKMKGVESVVPDLNNSEVVVKGTVQAAELVAQVHKKTNKKAVILKQYPEPKKKETKSGKHERKGR